MSAVEVPVKEQTCTCGAAWSLPMSEHRPGLSGFDHQIAEPPESVWHPLTWRERFRLLPGIHDLWFLTYYIGVRDRLRCPRCKAVGTWKPHGSLLERWFYKDIAVRRWLCKWCGHYTGPRGRVVAYADMESRAWAIPEPGVPRQSTPAEVLREHMGKWWPWHG